MTTFDALGFDPAPGELSRIESIAQRYRRAGDQLRYARDAMAGPHTWRGRASEAFARHVDELREDLGTAAWSMSQAAAALTDWHADLSELQRRARELELAARAARDHGAADELDAIRDAARRLAQQHDDAAHRIAGLLGRASAADDLNRYWVPRDLSRGAAGADPVAVALSNAIAEECGT